MSIGYDYGRSGMTAIVTPQGNPTVEAEMRILLPPAISCVTARLTSRAADPAERLRHYLLELPRTVEQFDTLKPYALGFACTGSSYLVDADATSSVLEAVREKFGFPVVTAAEAIANRLKSTGARRIGLVVPYPEWLASAASAYWQSRDIEVAAIRRIATASTDTRSIYALASADAAAAVEDLARLDLDAIVLSGTGMPSLQLLAAGDDRPPLISSNACLAAHLVALAPGQVRDTDGWKARLQAALATPAD